MIPRGRQPIKCAIPCGVQALRVSVGKLGVITRVQLRIVREVPVRRSLARLTPPEFLDKMRSLQDAAQAAGLDPPLNYSAGVGAAGKLPAWTNETEWFWVPQVCSKGLTRTLSQHAVCTCPPGGSFAFPHSLSQERRLPRARHTNTCIYHPLRNSAEV